MPRLKDPVRECFIEFIQDGKDVATCRHCAKTYTHNTTRLRRHILQECVKVPTNIKCRFVTAASTSTRLGSEINQDDESEDNPPSSAASVEGDQGALSLRSSSPSSSTTSGQSVLSQPAGKGTKRKSMDKFVDYTSAGEKAALDIAFAQAVYASGFPLTSFNSQYWNNFFSMIRPSYKVPSRYFLEGSLLDAEYAKSIASNSEKIQNAPALGIMTDSYTNTRSESVINIIITTPTPVLFKQIFRGEARETGAFVANHLIIAIKEVGPGKVWLLVTDNAANMKLAWELVIEEFPHITAVGCASHCWDLLFKDLIKLISIVGKYYNLARIVVRYVKKGSNVLAIFTTKQNEKYGVNSITLKLPGNTRWGGAVILMNSLMKNKAALQETVIAEGLDVDKNVRTCVLNDKFWARIKCISDLLTPIHAAITLIEGNKSLLSDVYYLHLKITDCVNSNLVNLRLSSSEKRDVKDLLQNRKDFTVAPIHMAAYMLDPRFKGHGQSNDDIGKAINFISELAGRTGLDEGSAIANLGEFRTNVGFFATPSILAAAERMQPSVWWRGVCSTQPLSSLAANLLSMPPSAAECERKWSDHGFVHSKSRNRLLNTRVTKLVTTRSSLNSSASQANKKSLKPLTLAELNEYFSKYLSGRSVGGGGDGEDCVDDESDLDDSEAEDTEWEWDMDNGVSETESSDESSGEAEEVPAVTPVPAVRVGSAASPAGTVEPGEVRTPPTPTPGTTTRTRASAARAIAGAAARRSGRARRM